MNIDFLLSNLETWNTQPFASAELCDDIILTAQFTNLINTSLIFSILLELFV